MMRLVVQFHTSPTNGLVSKKGCGTHWNSGKPVGRVDNLIIMSERSSAECHARDYKLRFTVILSKILLQKRRKSKNSIREKTNVRLVT